MVSVKDVPADDFVNALAAHLKSSGKIQLPKWNDIVKTGKNRELPPTNPDWFYVRAASLARRVYLAPNRGVGTLSVVYGGHKRNGVRRGHAYRSCTGILRNALQQLEKANIITKATTYNYLKII